MKSTDAEAGDAGQKNPARRDIVLVVAVAVIAAFVCVKLNVSEVLLNRTRPFEQLQLDEVPGVLLVIAVSLIWFSLRRYFVGFDDLGVTAAIEHCVNEWRSRLSLTTIEMSITGDFENLDETRGLVMYQLVQEALTNIARHARAANVQIRIAAGRVADLTECIEILIADNGSGADMRMPRTGLGLVGMRERVCALGGSITLAGCG